MAATDFLSTIYTRLWTIAEAHTALIPDIVKVGNCIKLSTTDNHDPTKTTWNDSDFPELALLYGEFSDSMFTLKGGTYARVKPAFNPATTNWTEEIRQTFVWQIIHKDMRAGPANRLKLELLTAMRKGTGAPILGLTPSSTVPQIEGFGPITSPPDRIVSERFGDFGDAGGTRRLMTQFNVPVAMVFSTPATSLTI